MSYSSEVLMNRKVSAFPLSVGTSLCFESIFSGRQPPIDPTREIPNLVDPYGYQEMWINVRTLFRNITAVIPTEDCLKIKPEEFAAVIYEEMSVIQNLFETDGAGVCRPVFYHTDYTKLYKQINEKIRLRLPTTEIQKHAERAYYAAIKKLKDLTKDLKETSGQLSPSQPVKALILTHYPWDLLSFKKFTKLDLIESNTGVLKSRRLWGSKMYPVAGVDLTTMPLTRRLLLIFGDRVMIQPFDTRLRKTILEIAKQKKWTGLTPTERVNLDLSGGIWDPYINQFVMSL